MAWVPDTIIEFEALTPKPAAPIIIRSVAGGLLAAYLIYLLIAK